MNVPDDWGREIETSPSTHFCLKRAWAEFKMKDPVDAVNDAQILLHACEARLAQVPS